MEITEFVRKRQLTANDCLIGFDESGTAFRIGIADLKEALGVKTVAAEKVTVHYSLDGRTWHTPYMDGDRYMRVKCGSGEWSEAIRISVSAYETWRERNGGKGTEEEFLASLRGKPGESVDVSKLKLSELDGYKGFLADVGNSITEAVDAYQKTMTERIAAIEGQVKAREKTERTTIALKGDQNGKNVTFVAADTFAQGTTQLYINGRRYVAGSDYLEIGGAQIILLTHVPVEGDVLVFVAVKEEAK